MYEYVTKSQVKPYKEYCYKVLQNLQKLLKEKKIVIQYELVGSGVTNLVTRNGSGSFDLDYNLIITSAPKTYFKNPEKLKNTIRSLMDNIIHDKFSYGQDSTASITYLLRSMNKRNVEFSLDIGIVRINPNTSQYERLIHDKKSKQYIWNVIRTFKNISDVEKQIKTSGKVNDLRAEYLRLKNVYLSKGDMRHLSQIIYEEALANILQSEGVQEDTKMSNNQNDSKYKAGKEKMFSIIDTLNRMSDKERYLYITGESASYYCTLSISDCISKYNMDVLEKAVDQYHTDNLELGDIFIREEDGLEYLVIHYENNTPGKKTYRCLSLLEDKEFILDSIREIKRTKKHINISKLRTYLR